jgi:hypothetical protein
VGWCQFGAPDEVPQIKSRGIRKKSEDLARLANRAPLHR